MGSLHPVQDDVEIAVFSGYSCEPSAMRIKIKVLHSQPPATIKGQFSSRD